MRVFVDTDVIISSIISKKGASFLLLSNTGKNLILTISDVSFKEIKRVARRLSLNLDEMQKLVRNFVVIQLKENEQERLSKFGEYVTDLGDAHIVAGAREANARFLISYNIRHFKVDKLKEDFDILVVTPANLLQYLRLADN